MKNSVRLFVCARLSPDALKAWDQFRAKAPTLPLRWIPTESLHITLKFLGETESHVQAKIISALESLPHKKPLMLGLQGGGIFPGKGPDATFWIGVDGEVEKFKTLAAAVDNACAPLGFKTESRAFVPHVTVARLRSDFDGAKKAPWLANAYSDWVSKFESMPFVVNHLALMKSLLTASGPRYEPVSIVNF